MAQLEGQHSDVARQESPVSLEQPFRSKAVLSLHSSTNGSNMARQNRFKTVVRTEKVEIEHVKRTRVHTRMEWSAHIFEKSVSQATPEELELSRGMGCKCRTEPPTLISLPP